MRWYLILALVLLGWYFWPTQPKPSPRVAAVYEPEHVQPASITRNDPITGESIVIWERDR